MRVLVVGVGAVGGYFGGLLAAIGRDVTFMVREARAAQLVADGLVIRRPDETVLTVDDPRVVTATTVSGPFDVVLLCVKAFGLEAAVSDLAPVVGPNTVVIPLLNGMQHLKLLQERLGADRVLGGVCRVMTQLEPDGTVRQLGAGASLRYGELDATRTERILGVDETMRGAGFDAAVADDIVQELWEKWFMLASASAVTTLLRGTVGDIAAVPHGAQTARAVLTEFVATARAAGHEPRPETQASVEATLTQPGSGFATSTYRDLILGRDVEADQLLGDLVRRATAYGVSVPLFAAADAALEVYRARR